MEALRFLYYRQVAPHGRALRLGLLHGDAIRSYGRGHNEEGFSGNSSLCFLRMVLHCIAASRCYRRIVRNKYELHVVLSTSAPSGMHGFHALARRSASLVTGALTSDNSSEQPALHNQSRFQKTMRAYILRLELFERNVPKHA
jgi:hypothetical protein